LTLSVVACSGTATDGGGEPTDRAGAASTATLQRGTRWYQYRDGLGPFQLNIYNYVTVTDADGRRLEANINGQVLHFVLDRAQDSLLAPPSDRRVVTDYPYLADTRDTNQHWSAHLVQYQARTQDQDEVLPSNLMTVTFVDSQGFRHDRLFGPLDALLPR
jgi:hypothetical protein